MFEKILNSSGLVKGDQIHHVKTRGYYRLSFQDNKWIIIVFFMVIKRSLIFDIWSPISEVRKQYVWSEKKNWFQLLNNKIFFFARNLPIIFMFFEVTSLWKVFTFQPFVFPNNTSIPDHLSTFQRLSPKELKYILRLQCLGLDCCSHFVPLQWPTLF